jgi:uncharacterized membrane protein
VIAALAMTAMIGALSMVVDAGVYFVIQRQLQNAADAAALDAVWFAPACNPDWAANGCQTSNPLATPAGCMLGDKTQCPLTAARDEARANWGVAVSLCAGPNLQSAGTVNVEGGPGETLTVPNVGTYVVTLSCNAPHWFARILPGVCDRLPGCAVPISSSAAAALGWLGPNGELEGDVTRAQGPNPKLVARLLI